MVDLSLFRNIKDRDLKSKGIVIGEGSLIVGRMLEADCVMLGIVCTPAMETYYRTLAKDHCPVMALSKKEQAQLTGFAFHRGVLGVARRQELPGWEAFLNNQSRQPETRRQSIAILPHVQEAENLGSIVRSAAAFGLDALFLGPGSCDPFSRKALRCSMGNAFKLPLYCWQKTEEFYKFPVTAGFSLIGTALRPDAISLKEYSFPVRTALVLGNEAEGMETPWLKACETLLTIPLAPRVDSLNVGVAAGIFFHALQGSQPAAAHGAK